MNTSGMAEADVGSAQSVQQTPLVVGVDGTLVRGDPALEAVFSFVRRCPAQLAGLVAAAMQGRAAARQFIGGHSVIDPARLAYDPQVVAAIEDAKRQGRPVYLASGRDEHWVGAVAAHLKLDGCFASDNRRIVAGSSKAEILTAQFGTGGFDYVGHDLGDFAVWHQARRCYGAGLVPARRKMVERQASGFTVLSEAPSWLSQLPTALRLRQWLKNILVFLPALAGHRFDAVTLALAIGAFGAFSLCASGVYIINDLLDIDDDRHDPAKCNRPFAAGRLAPQLGLVLAPLLCVAGLVAGAAIAPRLAAILALYCTMAMVYSLLLKRLVLLDVVMLACLYTARVLAGGAATGITVSSWLLAFSLMLFLALAFAKRCAEAAGAASRNGQIVAGRAYHAGDVRGLAIAAASGGVGAVAVFSVYIASDAVIPLYRSPHLLWAAVPVLLIWLGRMVTLAYQGRMRGDPVVVALEDGPSLLCAALLAAITSLALFWPF